MGFFSKKEEKDVITVTTNKNLSQISNVLRTFAGELKANVDRTVYGDDPLGDFDDTPNPDIAVNLTGGIGLFGPKEMPTSLMIKNGSDYWAIDVEAYDLGSHREVLLGISNMWGSKKHNYKNRDLLVELLNR